MEILPVECNFNKNYAPITISSRDVLTIRKVSSTNSPHIFSSSLFNELNIGRTDVASITQLGCKWREIYRVQLKNTQNYIPGDTIGIICPNSDVLVSQLMRLLNFENAAVEISRGGRYDFCFTGELADFFRYRFDFTSIPRKSMLLNVSKSCSLENRMKIEYLCSKEGTKDYLKLGCNWNNIMDILVGFGAHPSLEDLLEFCNILKPRYFSLINLRDKNMEVLVGAAKHEWNGVVRYGHTASFCKRGKLESIETCFRPNKLMQINGNSKLLAICVGTGIAPFISFAVNKERNQRLWIVYGFRNQEDDLSTLIDSHANLDISRVMSSTGKHVLDYLSENNSAIEDYVTDSCTIFICGQMKMQNEVFMYLCSKFPAVVEEKRVLFDNWQ